MNGVKEMSKSKAPKMKTGLSDGYKKAPLKGGASKMGPGGKDELKHKGDGSMGIKQKGKVMRKTPVMGPGGKDEIKGKGRGSMGVKEKGKPVKSRMSGDMCY